MRVWLAAAWLCILGFSIGACFWYNLYQYSRPTPVPANYKEVKPGTTINIPALAGFNNGKPLFLHFFNPDCPCSKFNMKHFKELVSTYGNRVNFAIILVSRKHFTPADIDKKFNLNLPVFNDSGIAAMCGVYSTPQAVLLTSGHQLYYRGNYNVSRYCSNPMTAFAKGALQNLLSAAPLKLTDALALKAYGCSLPGCVQ